MVDTVDPTISSDRTYSGTYQVALVDLSILRSQVNASDPSTLAPGLGQNRTTRLHWWQGNLTQSSNGSFVSSSSPLAPYAGPMPPLNDIPHDYVFYLLNQPANFTPPASAVAGVYQSARSTARYNFSIADVVAQVGGPVAANYMRVQNMNNTANATATGTGAASASSGVVASSSTGSPIPFTGSAAAGGIGSTSIAALVGLGAMGFAFALL